MATTASQVYLAVTLSIPYILGAYIKEYAMDDYCGRSISIGLFDHAIKLKPTDRLNYKPGMDCLVHIECWLFSRKLTAQFIDIDVDCTDSVQFYMSPLGIKQEYCGKSKPSPYVTSGSDLYVQFTSDNFVEDRGFTLLINSFYTGICTSFEFECANGRCLHNDLKNDGYDNCGDNSDEYVTKSYSYVYWWIWMIVGIVVFLVICVVITVLCCCVCKNKTPGHVIKQGTEPVVHYQNRTQGIQMNPWYATPTQPTQPQSVGVQGAYQPGTQPPACTDASGSTVYPPPQSATPGLEPNTTMPPPYSEKM